MAVDLIASVSITSLVVTKKLDWKGQKPKGAFHEHRLLVLHQFSHMFFLIEIPIDDLQDESIQGINMTFKYAALDRIVAKTAIPLDAMFAPV